MQDRVSIIINHEYLMNLPFIIVEMFVSNMLHIISAQIIDINKTLLNYILRQYQYIFKNFWKIYYQEFEN